MTAVGVVLVSNLSDVIFAVENRLLQILSKYEGSFLISIGRSTAFVSLMRAIAQTSMRRLIRYPNPDL